MKLLVVGDVSSTYFVAFVDNLKKWDASIEIDVLSTNSNIELTEIKRRYGQYYHNVFSYFKQIPLVRSIPFFRGIARVIYQRQTRAAIEKNNYDVVCVQGLFPHQKAIINWLSNVSGYIVGVIWGSDFYKRKVNHSEEAFKVAAGKCNVICVSTEVFQKDIMDACNFPASKFRRCIFGTTTLETLFEKQNEDPTESRRNLQLANDDFVITCGHNASENQQHKEVIEGLMRIKGSLPKKTLLLVPATYGGSKNYVAELNELLQRSGLRYRLLEHYLTDNEVACIRKASEIFIQVQVTDAYSASMQEHLFAKNVVITGNWLPYESLVEKGIYFETINDLDELSGKLKYVIENFALLKDKASKVNIPDKFKSSPWSVSIENWYNMLNEYKTTNTIH